MISGVFFDLDGTLADTAPDLAAALNHVLTSHGYDTLPYEAIRPHVSNGSIGLMRIGFGEPDSFPEYNQYRQELLDYYADNIAVHTSLFHYMDKLLDYLDQQAIKWGIVTNKPAYLTSPLVSKLGLNDRAASVVSGDTLAERKPDPAPLLHACELANCDAAESVYIGDAPRDIEAGKRAGMQTLIAKFGYIGKDEQPETWGANAMVDSAKDIIDWLKMQNHG